MVDTIRLEDLCVQGTTPLTVLIDFIAILLTPAIFLKQIINTNNTNMYVIHFHSKNIIKMCFPKVGFLKFQTNINHSLSITMG